MAPAGATSAQGHYTLPSQQSFFFFSPHGLRRLRHGADGLALAVRVLALLSLPTARHPPVTLLCVQLRLFSPHPRIHPQHLHSSLSVSTTVTRHQTSLMRPPFSVYVRTSMVAGGGGGRGGGAAAFPRGGATTGRGGASGG